MMSPEELETNAIDLAEKLNGKADVETLKKELDKYLNVYGVGLEAARSGILKKYSTTVISTATSNSVTKKVGDLRGDEMNVTVKRVTLSVSFGLLLLVIGLMSAFIYVLTR